MTVGSILGCLIACVCYHHHYPPPWTPGSHAPYPPPGFAYPQHATPPKFAADVEEGRREQEAMVGGADVSQQLNGSKRANRYQ